MLASASTPGIRIASSLTTAIVCQYKFVMSTITILARRFNMTQFWFIKKIDSKNTDIFMYCNFVYFSSFYDVACNFMVCNFLCMIIVEIDFYLQEYWIHRMVVTRKQWTQELLNSLHVRCLDKDNVKKNCTDFSIVACQYYPLWRTGFQRSKIPPWSIIIKAFIILIIWIIAKKNWNVAWRTF